jgi:hypothetical protein
MFYTLPERAISLRYQQYEYGRESMKKTLFVNGHLCSMDGTIPTPGGFVRLRTGFLFVTFLATAMSAHGSIVIDNFSCFDSVTLDGPAGPTAFNASYISCPGSIGGEREDFIANLTPGASGGSAGSVSTIKSNPPTGAITGTFGNGITGAEGMNWGDTPTGFDYLGLDLVGDSILVQIQSDSGGTINVDLATTLVPFKFIGSAFSATFSGSPSYQDVLIPLTGTPSVLGTAANLDDVNNINMYLSLDKPGSTYTIDGVAAVPEPSTLLLAGTCFLGILTRSIWRKPSKRNLT